MYHGAGARRKSRSRQHESNLPGLFVPVAKGDVAVQQPADQYTRADKDNDQQGTRQGQRPEQKAHLDNCHILQNEYHYQTGDYEANYQFCIHLSPFNRPSVKKRANVVDALQITNLRARPIRET
jgi:hypothetical protein